MLGNLYQRSPFDRFCIQILELVLMAMSYCKQKFSKMQKLTGELGREMQKLIGELGEEKCKN